MIRRLKIWILDKCIIVCKYGIARNLSVEDYEQYRIGRELLRELSNERAKYD